MVVLPRHPPARGRVKVGGLWLRPLPLSPGPPQVPSLLPTRRPHLGPSGPGLSSEVPRWPLFGSAKPGKLHVGSSLTGGEEEQGSGAAPQGSTVEAEFSGVTVLAKRQSSPGF